MKLNYSMKAIEDTVRRQDGMRQDFYSRVLLGNSRFPEQKREFRQGDVPVLYLAGEMWPADISHQDGGRIISRNFQDTFIEITGGRVEREQTNTRGKFGVTYGNFVAENPMENPIASNRLFTAMDYIQILISDGTYAKVTAGNNKWGNPGRAHCGEIAATYAKGSPNILNNEKGSRNLNNDGSIHGHGTFDWEMQVFDKFVYQPDCIVKSSEEAAALVNAKGGKVLSRIILDANKQHSDYLKTVEKPDEPVVFINGSIFEPWAKHVAEACKSDGIRFLLGKDNIDPLEDPVGYVRQMDSCTLAFLFHDMSKRKDNNRLLPYIESGHAVMTGKNVLYVSEPLEKMEAIAAMHPHVHDQGVMHRWIDEKPSKRFERTDISDTFHTMRYLSEFIAKAPRHRAYHASHLEQAVKDMIALANIQGVQ